MITAVSADGTDVRAVDQGEGPTILVLPPGMDDGTSWGKVAEELTDRYRVLRLHRRQYRMDLDFDAPVTMADEVADVLAMVAGLDGPVLLVGHGSGGVLALEAMLAAPAAFTGAVLYEPLIVLGEPEHTGALQRARAAAAAGRHTTAMTIYLRDIVQMNPIVARLTGFAVSKNLAWRERVPRQLDDTAAVDALGDRLAGYAAITVPVVLLSGAGSPDHLVARTEALAGALPRAEVVTLAGQGHDANHGDPQAVASAVEALADTTLRAG